MKTMTRTERFFWTHAGFSWKSSEETRAQGRRRCAAFLADAEYWAKDQGIVFTWEIDNDADLSWMTEAERAQDHECVGCVARWADDSIAGSLWGIVDPSRDDGRVVEAELAAEAKAEALDALMGAI